MGNIKIKGASHLSFISDNLQNEFLKESVCNLLYERLYVWFDGTCVPCDFDYKSYLNLGNVNKNTIKEIWHGKKYNNLRERHIKGERKCVEPCNRCMFGIN